MVQAKGLPQGMVEVNKKGAQTILDTEEHLKGRTHF